MNKIKLYSSKYLKSLILIVVVITACFFLFNEDDELLDKLKGNVSLIEKYNEFNQIGTLQRIIKEG